MMGPRWFFKRSQSWETSHRRCWWVLITGRLCAACKHQMKCAWRWYSWIEQPFLWKKPLVLISLEAACKLKGKRWLQINSRQTEQGCFDCKIKEAVCEVVITPCVSFGPLIGQCWSQQWWAVLWFANSCMKKRRLNTKKNEGIFQFERWSASCQIRTWKCKYM